MSETSLSVQNFETLLFELMPPCQVCGKKREYFGICNLFEDCLNFIFKRVHAAVSSYLEQLG